MFNSMIESHHPWLIRTKISICSNGLLYFEDKVQNFIRKFGYWCEVGFSIDGDKTLHDMCRVDLNGNGTYDRAIKAALVHHEFAHDTLNTKMTLSPQNISYTANAIIDLIQKGFVDIWVNCIYEEGWTYEHGAILYQQLKKVADYVIDNDLYSKVFIRMFDRKSYQPLPETETANWCGGVADMNLSVNYTGKLYSCIRYMESSLNGHQPELPLGSVSEGYLTTENYRKNYQLMQNITRQNQSTEECLNCPVAAGCGWCSAYNYEKFGDIKHRATFICPTHKAEALANVYYWNKLYKKLNLPDVFKLRLSDEDINKILSEEDKTLLYSLLER